MRKSAKFSPEVQERAVRMVLEHRTEHESQWVAISSISAKFGSYPARVSLKVSTGPDLGRLSAEGGYLRPDAMGRPCTASDYAAARGEL